MKTDQEDHSDAQALHSISPSKNEAKELLDEDANSSWLFGNLS